MQSKATTVDKYLEEVPIERLEAIKKLRELCLLELKGYEEKMAYGGPCYWKNEIVEVGFASQKHFIGLYILKTDVMQEFRDELKGRGISIGKGCIRFAKPERINFDVVKKMLNATFLSKGIICG